MNAGRGVECAPLPGSLLWNKKVQRFPIFWSKDGRGHTSRFLASYGIKKTRVRLVQLTQQDMRINRDA